MRNLTPREIVGELDAYIIGQDDAKRAVAVALRNRWRRQQLDPTFAKEVAPKNIIMIGPTGVGKTEIARRLATLTGAPFVKVEASKYTEVGYHGRDVESMIRDLLEVAINMVRAEQAEQVKERAMQSVEQRLVDILMGEEQPRRPRPRPERVAVDTGPAGEDIRYAEPESGALDREDDEELHERVRQRMRERLRDGFFDDREIEITIREKQTAPIIGMMGPDQFDPGMSSFLENLMPDKSKRRKVTVARARSILLEEETEKLLDNEKLIEQAIERTQEAGIIFLDEVDKIASPTDGKAGSADVSRQGVQRDLLPIVEGSAVNTRHGVVHTDGILFIAAGAFHSASVSDLMPELQGRFPIRVELTPLTREDFRRILTEPRGALTVQQKALLETEGLEIRYEDDAIDAMAELAAEANGRMENIGARRLMTIIERVFEEISFEAPELAQDAKSKKVTIAADFVRERLRAVLKDEDLSRFVL